MDKKILITDIQHFSVNDGPGFRTNVYFKGCNMRCAWCHNPETQALYPEIYWKKRLCVQCGACLDACGNDAINAPIPPEEAISELSTYHKIIRERCNLCMDCVEACKFGALETVGKEYTVEEVLEEVMRDEPFYSNSGGGMTVTGGEPTAHPEFLSELLIRAKQKGLHICMDTTGNCSWDILHPLLENLDIVLYDLKHLDSSEHERMTGVGNKLVLENLKRICEVGHPIWVRIPIVPEYNDSGRFHRQVVEFLKSLPRLVDRVDLLPFHNWCQEKYAWLGKEWGLTEWESLEPTFLNPTLEIYEEAGINATIGGSGFEDTESGG